MTEPGPSQDQPTGPYPWSASDPRPVPPPAYGQMPAGQPPVYGPPTQYLPGPPGFRVAPKSPGIALLASFFIPGLGSMMNGEAGKGVGILVGYLISLVLILVFIGVFGCLAFWIWGMVDAYQGAQRWNARHGILS